LNWSANLAAAGVLHAVGACLVEVVTLASRVESLHVLGSLLAVLNRVAQGIHVQGLGMKLPLAEVFGSCVIRAHGGVAVDVQSMPVLASAAQD